MNSLQKKKSLVQALKFKTLTALILGAIAMESQAEGAFNALGFLNDGSGTSNYFYTVAYFVSADGLVAAGQSVNSQGINEGFRWYDGTMTGLGFLNDGSGTSTSYYNNLERVSADGSVIVGSSGNSLDNNEAYRWYNGTMTGLGFLDKSLTGGNYSSSAESVSADGLVVVGQSINSQGNTEAFRWYDGTMTGLGFLNDGSGTSTSYGSRIQDVSADGSTVIGNSTNSQGNTEAYRWYDGTMTGLGFLNDGTGTSTRYNSSAIAVSAYGLVVVGQSINSQGNTEAFRWYDGTMTGLGFLNDGSGTSTSYYSEGKFISANGSAIAGNSTNSQGSTEAYRWYDGTMTGLGFLNDGSGTSTSYFSNVRAFSEDGSVVVGTSTNSQGSTEAFRWSVANGMQSISAWLASSGVTVPTAFSSSYSGARSTSANGNVVVGDRNEEGFTSSWLARVGPAGAGLLTDTSIFNSSLIESGSRAVQGVAALPALALFGGHNRSILDNGLVRTGKDGSCGWSTMNAGGYNPSNSQSQLAEAGVCKDVGTARFGIGIGQAWTQQDLSLNGSNLSNGQYLLMEGAKAFENGLQPSIIGYFGRFDSTMARHYMNGAMVDSSGARANSNAYAVSAKLEWKDAETIGRFSLSPYAAYTWSQSKLDAYTETGGSFPASFEASTWTTNDIRVGSAARTALSPSTHLRLGAEIVHRFENNTSGVNGQVTGLWGFSLPSQSITQTWTRAMVDVDHRITDRVALTAGSSVSSTGSDASWILSAGLRANF